MDCSNPATNPLARRLYCRHGLGSDGHVAGECGPRIGRGPRVVLRRSIHGRPDMDVHVPRGGGRCPHPGDSHPGHPPSRADRGRSYVVQGARWPGPEVVWSCTVAEARGFELTEQRDDRGRVNYRVVLRTTDAGKCFRSPSTPTRACASSTRGVLRDLPRGSRASACDDRPRACRCYGVFGRVKGQRPLPSPT